ncbi:DUF4363 family protein [Porcipelethomonas sp.]|uniref:DUF4363 family protein n=1 Tax=Porcipelethomonas sp. TaxID=2981675 RepID=UPI003EF4419E
MGRIKVSLAILVSIIILCICTIFVLDNKTDKVIELLDETKKYSDEGDTQKALESVKILEKEWEQYQSFASIFVRNDKITSVQTSMSRLRPLIENNNDELNAEFENARSSLEWIVESEIPRFSNIM